MAQNNDQVLLVPKSNTPKPPLVLALDVGTSSARALLFDADGAVVPDIVSQHKYQLTTSAAGEDWSLTIGTSSAIRVVVRADDIEPPPGLWLYLIDGKRAVLGGALSEGGNLVAWVENTLKSSLKDIRSRSDEARA